MSAPGTAYVEPDWQDWRALLAAWPEGEAAITALDSIDAFGRLAAHAPLLVGTFPLGLALPGSDLDIACHMPDPVAAGAVIRRAFGTHGAASDRLFLRDGVPTLVYGFEAEGHAIEIFGQPVAPREQFGHRHLRAEHVLLWRHGEALRAAVRDLKQGGMKTEPAFAAAIGLPAGDAYRLVLDHADAVAAQAGLALRF
ncbi:DUF4269 domain-containing protein [Roseomonas sp. CAU 1739]|uniref:DUF4269 domain-containing protein n=1 Tax=Roseomonas sp. CAU 1739 TaxID=3140364 RepID=UPI00325A567E